MNRQLDKSQIVNQWGPWTLTKDGCLHNSDVSKKCNENWYLSLNNMKTQYDLRLTEYMFMRHLLLVSNQKGAFLIMLKIFDLIFPSRCVDGAYNNSIPSWHVKDSSFYIRKYIQNNFQRKRVNLRSSLRFKILHRDNYTCQACGVTAGDGAKLHIDHILPVSKGGTNEESNLRVLCSECNIGRGNRYDT